jgi:putative ABC transport system substrate-binding protein
MRRREFIIMLGGAALTSGSGAFAQPASKVFRVGTLSAGSAMSDANPIGASLLRGFTQLGYTQGTNLVFDRRGAEGHLERLPGLISELSASQVDVIITGGYPAALAAKEHSKLPVVAIFAGDPVGTGLVESLARPGGNVTGISDVSKELTPKRMELLKEFSPQLRRIAMLWNASDLGMTLRYQASEAGAKEMGITVVPLGVREPDDFAQAFAAMESAQPDAILMVTDSLTLLNRKRVFDFAAAHRLPATYEFDFLVRDGGLMSYAPDLDESFGRVAALADRIFKGAAPAELPFEQPTRFKFALNLKTAKAIGIDVPPTLLSRADEVIE